MSRNAGERSKPQPERTPGLETDPRFPSGPWTGFWVQTRLGRQWMTLHLRFKDGTVAGEGVDSGGRFIFTGRYELSTGKCELTKSYLGMHDVHYRGQNDNDGLWLWGVWQLERSTERGGFHMWPAGEQDPTGRKLRAERDADATAEEAVRIKLPALVE